VYRNAYKLVYTGILGANLVARIISILTTDEKFDLLLSRVESVMKLLALRTVANMKTGEAVKTLDRSGLDRKMIAEVLGTTQSSVRGFISLNTKSTKGKSKKKEVQIASSPN
jgi:hypothetical protein